MPKEVKWALVIALGVFLGEIGNDLFGDYVVEKVDSFMSPKPA